MKQRASKKKLPRRSLGSHSHITKGSAVQNHHRNNHGAADAGAPSVEEDLASLKTTIELPPSSFEFYVWSDEGISLHVNLNSSPSDWTKRFKKDVCVTENLHGNESWSFCQDLGRFREKSAQRNSSFLQNTLKSLSMTGNFADKLKDNQTIASAALTANMASNLKKGQSTVSAELSYSAPNNFMSGAESCAKYASKEILDSDVPDTSFRKSLCGSVGNSLSDPGKLELQNPKSVGSSVELQISEVASCHKYASVSLCEIDGAPSVIDPKNITDTEQGGLVDSSEFNLDTNGNNLLSLTEEWVGKIVSGRESSECSKFDDPHKKSGRDSKMELQKKRKRKEPEVPVSNGNPFTRILRSMRAFLPRRSMRLISKRL